MSNPLAGYWLINSLGKPFRSAHHQYIQLLACSKNKDLSINLNFNDFWAMKGDRLLIMKRWNAERDEQTKRGI
jgi:hypothetical protein